MRRFRAFWGVGLALGLSGCAGTNQCFLSKPCLTSKPTAGGAKLKKLCFLSKLKNKKCGPSIPMATPQSMAKPRPWGSVVSSAVPMPPVSEGAPPPPMPLPDLVARYFPTFNPRGTPRVVEANWPDPLGVRSLVSRLGSSEEEAAPSRAVPIAADQEPPAEMPATELQETSARKSASEAEAGQTTAEGGRKAEAAPLAVPVAPEPLPNPAIPFPVPPIEPTRPRAAALQLESKQATALAGRPDLTRSKPVARPRPGERTDAIGDLVFPASYYAVDPRTRLVPVPRENPFSEHPRRISILSRLVRWIRGTAFSRDAEPGSARRETRDVAQERQAIQRISADRLDEPSQR
jgi:hypothetical protein